MSWSRAHLGTCDQILILSEFCCVVFVRRPLWRVRVRVRVRVAFRPTLQAASTYISVDVLRRTKYRSPVGSLKNAVLCCALFTKPYHSNDGAVLLRVCVAMGMLLHSNEHLETSTVADRLSMFATCRRILWKAPTDISFDTASSSALLLA
jgi:hypothetical protein